MTARVTIAGLGLIGGSLGMALRRKGWEVLYADPHVVLDDAQRAQAADSRVEELRGELAVIATPLPVARAIHSDAALTTTTCSLMQGFDRAGWIAGHPFAGSERSGLQAARADLFSGRPWFIARDHPLLARMIEDAGAQPQVIDPAEHDRLLALTSHLPQALSTALASLIERKEIDPRFIGSGMRSMLRLAGSSFEIWDAVLEENRLDLASAREELMEIMGALGADDFARARRLMDAIDRSDRRES